MSLIAERPGDSLAQLIADYPTVSRVRAPGLLHAIATCCKTPADMLRSVRFLTRVADEVKVIEPDKVLRGHAIEFLILFPIRRMEYDAEYCRVLERIVWFFARVPKHYWHCVVDEVGNGPETKLVQSLLQHCWKAIYETRDGSLGNWKLPTSTMLAAMINCRMPIRLLRGHHDAIVMLFDRVINGIRRATQSRHEPRYFLARERLLSGRVIGDTNLVGVADLLTHYDELAMITDLAECLAPSTDSMEDWEAGALMSLVRLQLSWQRLLPLDTPAA